MTESFTITPVARRALPIGRWRRWWLRIRRKPLPLEPAPPGTMTVSFDTTRPDGTMVRTYIPCARIERTAE